MSYEIHLSRAAYDTLKKIDKSMRLRLIKKFDLLSQNPYPKDAKKIVGRKENILMVLVGSYRILYEVIEKDNVILIVKIDKRSRVY